MKISVNFSNLSKLRIYFNDNLLFFNFHSGQKATIGRLESMFGIWEDKESDYSLKLEISKNNDTNDFLFALINSRGEKFIVNKSHIFENDNKAIVIEIEEAKPESLSLQNNEKDLIIKALEKHKGRRNKAADELGISQRTLYRKIKQYNLED